MAIKYLSSINLSKNELQNAAIQNLAAAPSNPVLGQIYFNTVDNELYVCSNTTGPVWDSLGGDIEAVIAGAGLTGGGSDGSVTLNIGSGTGITVNADDIQIKNAGSLTDDTLSKWDSTNGQFVDSSISDDGSTVTIAADLIVTGSTTSVNSNEVNIGDSIILLNSDEAGTPSQNAGFEVERGTSANVSFIWNEGSDYFSTVDQKLHIGSLPDFGATTGTSEILLHSSGEVQKLDISTALAVLQFVGNSGISSIGSTAYITIQGDGTTITTDASSNALTISIADASQSVKGAVELATDLEAKAGTDNTRAVTPQGLEAHHDSKRHVENVGNGTLTSIPITHDLFTRDVIVQVYDNATYETVFTDVVRTDANTVTLNFAEAPTLNQYRVLITSMA